jgi:hypothetical protein
VHLDSLVRESATIQTANVVIGSPRVTANNVDHSFSVLVPRRNSPERSPFGGASFWGAANHN